MAKPETEGDIRAAERITPENRKLLRRALPDVTDLDIETEDFDSNTVFDESCAVV